MFNDVLVYVIFFYGAVSMSVDFVRFCSRKIKAIKLARQLKKAVNAEVK